jgi:tRNA threonylcarbamoyladenosine biosynthesis protein TsaB
MYILGIETTGAFASVALMKDDKVIGHVQGSDRFSHLQNLMPQVQAVVKECELSLGDMDAIAVSRGPGSFTGIRIGVSSARALAQVMDMPTIAVPTLKSFAYNAPDFDGLICPVFDARRSQVYAGAYRWIDGKIVEVVEGAPYSIDEFVEKTEAAGLPRMIFGDGIKAYGDRFAPEEIAPEEIRLQVASSVAKLAKDMYEAGETVHYELLKPNYMRKAEAERKLEEQGGKC